MPTAAFPGIGASIRIPVAARLRAMSSERFTILLTFTPWLGVSSYLVTVGPLFICTTFAETPKLWSVSSSFLAFSSISSPPVYSGSFPRRSRGGNTYSFLTGSAGLLSTSFAIISSSFSADISVFGFSSF